jgi:hypothetical protein
MALGFAPLPLVRNIYTTMMQQSDPVLAPLFGYFSQQWLTNVRPSMWNVCNEDIRTNNDCEGWHNRLNRLVARHHPNLWHCVNCLIEEQNATDVLRQQLAAGQMVQRNNRKYKQVQARIRCLYDRYMTGNITVIEYITGVSHNI